MDGSLAPARSVPSSTSCRKPSTTWRTSGVDAWGFKENMGYQTLRLQRSSTRVCLYRWPGQHSAFLLARYLYMLAAWGRSYSGGRIKKPLPSHPKDPMQRESHLNNAALFARREAAIPRGVGQDRKSTR